jgi:hypothetical protein
VPSFKAIEQRSGQSRSCATMAGISETDAGSRLAEKLGLSEIQPAAQVEDDLRGFLSLLGFPTR